MQYPGCEETVRLLGAEGRGRPVPARRERGAGEVEEAAPAEPPQHPLAEAQPPGRPELRPQDAEGEIGVGHELLELPLPGGAVTRREAVELGDVRLQRRLEEHGRAVRVRRGRGEVGVDVFEAPAMQLLGELRIRRRSLEERVPGAQHLVREAGQRVVGLRSDRAPEAVGLLEYTDRPAVPREQRAGRQRVDPGSDEHGVERGHGARLPRPRFLDMSPAAV